MSNLRTRTISGSIQRSTGLANPKKETKIYAIDSEKREATLLSRFGNKMYTYTTKERTISSDNSTSVAITVLPGASIARSI